MKQNKTSKKKLLEWFKNNLKDKSYFTLEEFTNACLEISNKSKKEVFDDIEKFNDTLSKRLYNSIRYKELKKRHLSTSTLEEHEKDCSCCKSINEKGKADKINTNSNQSTPQIMATDDILQLAEDNANKDAYELNGTFYADFLKQKFIQLSSVEATLNEILTILVDWEEKCFSNNYISEYELLKELKQIITKNFKNIGVE